MEVFAGNQHAPEEIKICEANKYYECLTSFFNDPEIISSLDDVDLYAIFSGKGAIPYDIIGDHQPSVIDFVQTLDPEVKQRLDLRIRLDSYNFVIQEVTRRAQFAGITMDEWKEAVAEKTMPEDELRELQFSRLDDLHQLQPKIPFCLHKAFLRFADPLYITTQAHQGIDFMGEIPEVMGDVLQKMSSEQYQELRGTFAHHQDWVHFLNELGVTTLPRTQESVEGIIWQVLDNTEAWPPGITTQLRGRHHSFEKYIPEVVDVFGTQETLVQHVAALLHHESHNPKYPDDQAFRSFAVSSAGAIGLGQVMPNLSKSYQINPFNNYENIAAVIALMVENYMTLDNKGVENITPELLIEAHQKGANIVCKYRHDLSQIPPDNNGNPAGGEFYRLVLGAQTRLYPQNPQYASLGQ